jgi:hypothetical protein
MLTSLVSIGKARESLSAEIFLPIPNLTQLYSLNLNQCYLISILFR